jgi:hypothetical protein
MKRFLTLAMASLLIGGSAAWAGGPELEQSATVEADHTHTYTLTFRAGEKAVVGIHGNGSSDLDLLVFDENGNPVAVDDDDTDECIAVWTPAWTGKFTVKVVNQGDVSNRYEIMTN